MRRLGLKALRRSRQRFKRLRDDARAILETVREPFLILDTDLRVRSANRSFYRTFHVAPRQTEGRLIYDLGNGQWRIPRLRVLLDRILSANSALRDFPVDHDFLAIGRKTMLLNARRIREKGGSRRQSILLAIEDITERTKAERKLRELNESLRRQSLTDALTGLCNRRGFSLLGRQYLKAARRGAKASSIFLVDLNGLKRINDRFGHAEGDRALVKTAQSLRNTFRKSDLIARTGGDEFAVMTVGRAEMASLLTARLRVSLRRRAGTGPCRAPLSAGIGVANSNSTDSISLEDLTAQADSLMYKNKKRRATDAGHPADSRTDIDFSLLSLPEDVQKLINNSSLSKEHGASFLKMSDMAMQSELAQAVADRGLSVRQTDALVNTWKTEGKGAVGILMGLTEIWTRKAAEIPIKKAPADFVHRGL